MQRLKVGDVVLIRVRVDKIEAKDDFTPYLDIDAEGSVTRFGDHQVVEVLEGSSEGFIEREMVDPDHPARAGVRLTVGDRVIHKRRGWLGVGEIMKDDHTALPYHVRWPDGGVNNWVKPADLIRAPVFEPGDRVEHVVKGEWGRGVVREVVDLAPFHYRMHDYFGGDDLELRECSRSYKVEFERVIQSPAGPTNTWWAAEENLIRRRDGNVPE